MVPDQPADDRFWRSAQQKDVLPWDEHIFEPHLSVELVIAVAQRGDKRVRIANRHLAAHRGDAGRIDRDDEGRAVPVDIDARKAADIDVLGKGWARMHTDLSSDDDAGIGRPDELQGRALARILAHTGADRRGAAAEGQESPG